MFHGGAKRHWGGGLAPSLCLSRPLHTVSPVAFETFSSHGGTRNFHLYKPEDLGTKVPQWGPLQIERLGEAHYVARGRAGGSTPPYLPVGRGLTYAQGPHVT